MTTLKQKTAPRGRRHVQRSHGIGSNILKLAEKVVKAPIIQELGKMSLNKLPNLYSKGADRIKNKEIGKILQSDLVNTLVDMGAEYDRN